MRLYTLLAILLLSTCILIVVVDAKARHSARTVQDEAKSVDADVDDIDDDDSTDLADLSSEEENYDDAESDVAAWEGAAHADAQLVCTKSANDPCECKMSNGNTLDCRRSPKKTDRNTAKILFTTKIKVKDEDFHAKIVYMSGNEIRELRAKDLLPGQEATVESLDFYNNNIADVRPDAFDKFEKLKKLRLSRNFISITEQNAGWLSTKLGKTLSKLYLGYNMIQRLRFDAFKNMKNLQTLVLDGNSAFGSGLANLKELSLDFCNLETLPDDIFANLKSLEGVSLLGNPLKGVPAAIGLVPMLTDVDLSESVIVNLAKGAFKGATKLKMIKMRSMPLLKQIEKCALCELTALEELDLTGSSKLATIDADAFGYSDDKKKPPTALKKLRLEGCNLTTLDEKLAPWHELDLASLGSNPFNCDQKLDWLTARKLLQNFGGDTAAKCAAPESLKGKLVQRIGNIGKPFLTKLFYFFVFIVSVGGLVGLILVYRNRHSQNPFYRPQMPKVGFANLHLDDEPDDDDEQPPPQAV